MMNQEYHWGDKLMTKNGNKVIFEECDQTEKTICFVIPDPDSNAEGSMMVRLSNLKQRD